MKNSYFLKSKLNTLLEFMDKRELESFLFVIKKHKRINLYQLLNMILKIRKGKLADNKEHVFKNLFGKDYSKKEDFLLRNEMRLLTGELRWFLIRNEAEAELKEKENMQNYYYLKLLVRKKADDLVEKNREKFIGIAIESGDFNWAEKMASAYVDYRISQKAPTIQNYTVLDQIIDNRTGFIEKHFNYNRMDVLYKKSFLQRSLKELGGEFSKPPLKEAAYHWSEPHWQDAYIRFMRIMTESYFQYGKEKIGALKDAARLIPEIRKEGFDQYEFSSSCYASIALEYFLSGNYQESLVYHKKALEQKSRVAADKVAVYVYNYLSTLMRLRNYLDALELINENEQLLLSNQRVRDRSLCMKCMSLIFLGRFEEAESALPEDRKQGGMLNYFYYRVIQVILFYSRGEVELALRETENLMQGVYYHKNETFKNLTNHFNRFLNLELIPRGSRNYQNSREEAKSQLGKLDNWEMNQYILLYDWLAEKYV